MHVNKATFVHLSYKKYIDLYCNSTYRPEYAYGPAYTNICTLIPRQNQSRSSTIILIAGTLGGVILLSAGESKYLQ